MKECGSLAQSVEQWTENPCVPGSIPGAATIFFARIPKGEYWDMKFIFYFCVIASSVLTGCVYETAKSDQPKNTSPVKAVPVLKSEYVFSSYPENSLNVYNSFWDEFAGSMDVGKVYPYSNRGFSSELQFKVLQVLDENTVLIIRSSEIGYPFRQCLLDNL